MPAFDRLFNRKRWAAGGGVSEPSDAQANQGFAYLPNGKPTVEGFNSLFQMLDDKDNWNYAQVFGVLSRAGMTPASSGDFQLADALRSIMSRPWTYVEAAGTGAFAAGATTTVHFVLVVGGGGGSGGCDNVNVRCGPGGGGGGASLGLVNLTPGQVVQYTVGAGGAGQTVAGQVAIAGGTTSFGSFMSATGGGGGAGFAGGFGGVGSGGLMNLQGTPGGDGNTHATPTPTGYGGPAALLGGGGRASTPLTAGSIGRTPGGGAPAPYNTPVVFANGLGGRPGCILVVPVA